MKHDLMPRAPPKLDFVFIFTTVFKISMKFVCFGGPFFPAMRGLNGEMSAMRRFEQRCVRCVRDSMACFLRFGPCDAKLRCASRDLPHYYKFSDCDKSQSAISANLQAMISPLSTRREGLSLALGGGYMASRGERDRGIPFFGEQRRTR